MQNNEIVISIVMPTYNSEKHIREAIESIISQTYTNWELLIIDGHSKDKTISIIEEFSKIDRRIMLHYDEGKGIGPALHQGCLLAKGTYIARMDSDDISFSNRLREQLEYMESHPRVALVSCIAEYMNDNGEFLGYGFPYTSQTLVKRNLLSIFHPGVLMRKDAYLKAGGYPPLRRAEDLFLWNRIIKYGDVKIFKYPLLKYRVSDDALSSSMTDFFKKNCQTLWKIVAQKETIGEYDYAYLNQFISENIVKECTRENPVRKSENVLFMFFKSFLPYRLSFKPVLILKNLYGYFSL